jgi:mRNA-degrading endonuclease RelE of RelBE toxin-antitoxin system
MYRVLVERSAEKDIGKLPTDKAAQAPSMKKAQELAPRYRTTLLKA